MRVRAFSLTPVPENYALSFASVTSDIGMLQELNYRKDTKIVPYMIVLITIMMGFAIIAASFTHSDWMILFLPAAIIFGCIVAFVWMMRTIDTGLAATRDDSITIIIDDEGYHA